MFDQLADAAIDLADQLAHFARLALQRTLLHAFQHAGRNPPQATARDGVATRGDGVQRLDHAAQLLVVALAAEPRQQLLLEAQAQRGHFVALALQHQLVRRLRRLGRQRNFQVGREQRRLVQRLLAAAGAQVVQQRQQHHRHVAMTAGQALEVIGQLHQAAHQRGVGFLALGHMVFEQRDGECLHLLGDHGGAV